MAGLWEVSGNSPSGVAASIEAGQRALELRRIVVARKVRHDVVLGGCREGTGVTGAGAACMAGCSNLIETRQPSEDATPMYALCYVRQRTQGSVN